MKLTPWFPPEIKPAYPGVYEVSWTRGRFYRRWDGKRWCVGSRYPERAANNVGTPTDERSWRGLAEPPKGWTK